MLHGLVTESDLPAIEESFPGIWRFYTELHDKPGTFLELVWLFAVRLERGACEAPVAMAPRVATQLTTR